MTVGSDNPFPSVLFAEHVDPATPPAGHWRLFVDTDNTFKVIDEAGTVTSLATGSGAMATDALWDAAGDLAVGTGANTGAKLTIGTTNYGLKVVAGTPAWGLPHSWGCIISGTSTALTSGAFVSLAFGTADTYDPDAYHDPSSGNTLITVPSGKGGQYNLIINMTWPSSGSANTDRRMGYRINGGGDINIHRETYSVTSVVSTLHATANMVLAAGDTVEVRQWTGIAATTTTAYSASLFLIGV